MQLCNPRHLLVKPSPSPITTLSPAVYRSAPCPFATNVSNSRFHCLRRQHSTGKSRYILRFNWSSDEPFRSTHSTSLWNEYSRSSFLGLVPSAPQLHGLYGQQGGEPAALQMILYGRRLAYYSTAPSEERRICISASTSSILFIPRTSDHQFFPWQGFRYIEEGRAANKLHHATLLVSPFYRRPLETFPKF